MNLEKTFEAEEPDDDCVLDSSDDEYFPPSQVAASGCDDTDKDQEDEDKESEDGEDEDEESEVEATAFGMTARGGTQWAATSPSEHQAGRRNIIREKSRYVKLEKYIRYVRTLFLTNIDYNHYM
ncbi:uncharacterized protein LOC143203272 [Rhynchophorus ferrugineus]|uniref:uncharacterized protein LOC143203272 n=1 Tax=Rhynchophorus ferrugineus TaxID=354439 RepID=UPI003FCD4F85